MKKLAIFERYIDSFAIILEKPIKETPVGRLIMIRSADLN
jgi:hypothetical protein